MSSQISTAVTYTSRSARSLLDVLRQSLSERGGKPPPNSVLLFALAPSLSTPPKILSEITSTLTRFHPEHVGCISAPLPSQHFGRACRGPDSCSLAYAFVNGVSFHSTISGRAEAQVGRWHAARHRTKDESGEIQVDPENARIRILSDCSDRDGRVNWDHIWDHTAGSVRRHGVDIQIDTEALPDVLRKLDPLATDNILYFSDKTPEGLAIVLEGAFPQANKLSLIASSTPFITGRPVTLFHNGSVHSRGAVGIALSSAPSSPPPLVEVSFPSLVTLCSDLTVTSSEGNLILSLDSGNPTQLLLAAIQKYNALSSPRTTCMDKDDAFYVGVIDASSQHVSRLQKINAGDPSRGTIALDGSSAPGEGSIVRLYHLPKDPFFGVSTYEPEATPNISLFVAPEAVPTSFKEDAAYEDNSCSISPSAFLAASENGFTVSRGAQGQGPWKCVVPGARTGLSWKV